MAQEILVRFKGDAGQLNRTVSRVNRSIGSLERNSKVAANSLGRIQGVASRVSAALTVAGVAFAGFITQRGISGILNATQQMEQFRTQLTTYLGSQARANAELERLSELAQSLPQDVNELTEAFVIFNRFGLDTSNESMTAFSKIAAANSKSIIQFGEAVADALTGEFERLKEFGIKVSTENGIYTARIGEDQVAVANSTKDLIAQIRGLGEEGGRFFNVAVGPLTLAMSNLRGAIFEASAALGEKTGFGLAIAETATKIQEFIKGNDVLIQKIGTSLTKAFLYAIEIGKFFIANIELIGKALLLLISIKVALFFANMAKAIISIALPALVMLGKGIKTAISSLLFFVPGGPLVRGIIAGIGGLAAAWGLYEGATSDAAKETVDSFLDIDNILKGLGIEGLDELRSGLEGVTAEAKKLEEQAKKANEAMSKQEAAAAAAADQEAAAAKSANDKVKAFNEYLAAKKEEYRVSNLTALEQEKIKLILDAQKKLKRDLTEDEKKLLRAAVDNNEKQKQITEELKKQADAAKEIADYIEKQSKGPTTIELLQTATSTEERLQTPGEAALKAFEEEQRALEAARREGSMNEERYQKNITRLKAEYAKKQLEIAREKRQQEIEQAGITNSAIKGALEDQLRFSEMIQQGGVKAAEGVLGSLTSTLGQMAGQNKKAFEAYKALSIAQALISTYKAAALAISFPPGPPISFLYVAGALAAGMAQVNAIRSMQYSGRALGGPVMGNTPYMVGENGPELFTPATSGNITRNSDLSMERPVNITFNINAIDTQGIDELLVDRRSVITQIVSDAMLETGQRSRF